MNKRIKKKHLKQKNKELCERYPFLIPRIKWNDEIAWGSEKWYIPEYTFTELDCMPRGWRKAFGKQMLEEIREDLIKCDFLYDFRILEIKEKFGGLRFYYGGAPIESKVDEIVDKYENMSFHICERCGRPAETIDNCGWLTTICEGCQSVFNNNQKQWHAKRERHKQKEKAND